MAMAESDVVYSLDIGKAEPLYLACCADIKDEIFQTAASLMQETLQEAGVDSGQDVVFESTGLREPSRELEAVAQAVRERRIFDEYGFLRIASITKEGASENTSALGVGTNNEKLKRASKLALAVAVAMERPDPDAWLRLHSIRIAEDPLNGALDAMEHRAARDERPRRTRTIAIEARQRSRSREWNGCRLREAPERGTAGGSERHLRQASQTGVSERHGCRLREASQRGTAAALTPYHYSRSVVLDMVTRNNGRSQEPGSPIRIDGEDVEERPRGRWRKCGNSAFRERIEPLELPRAHSDVNRMSAKKLDVEARKKAREDVKLRQVKEEDGAQAADPNLWMRPPPPWVLIWDFDARHLYYWHPTSFESTWDPPPGSQPACAKVEPST